MEQQAEFKKAVEAFRESNKDNNKNEEPIGKRNILYNNDPFDFNTILNPPTYTTTEEEDENINYDTVNDNLLPFNCLKLPCWNCLKLLNINNTSNNNSELYYCNDSCKLSYEVSYLTVCYQCNKRIYKKECLLSNNNYYCNRNCISDNLISNTHVSSQNKELMSNNKTRDNKEYNNEIEYDPMLDF